MTTEHGAPRANSKMRPEDLPMHHDLRFCCMFLTDMRSLQGRPEAQGRLGAQGVRKLAPQKSLKLWCSSKMSIKSMHRNIKRSYALGCEHLLEHVRSLLITPVAPIFFDRKVAPFYIHGQGIFQQGISTQLAILCQADVARD